MSDTELLVDLPSRGSARGSIGAFIFGIPWLVLLVATAVTVVSRVPPDMMARALLALFLGFILTILITVLALASIWYALYSLWGRERLRIDIETLSVTREVARVPVPFRAKRGFADRVVFVERDATRARPTHYRLEAHAGRSKIRFAAGVTEGVAQEVQQQASEFLKRTRDEAIRTRE